MTVLAGGVAYPLLAEAQQKAMPVIGWLSGASPGSYALFAAAFRQGLSDAGYVEGQNVAIDYRWANGEYDRLAVLAAGLVRRKVDVIAALSLPAALAAKSATSTIPIVFVTGDDPVANGLVASLARPGGNVTGVSFLGVELQPKKLELLSDLLPQAKLIDLLVNPTWSSAGRTIEGLQEGANAKGVQLHILKVVNDSEIDTAFSTLKQMQAGALLVVGDPFFNSRRDQLVALAARYAVPAINDSREYAKIGGLISYGTSLTAVYRQIGTYAGKILSGAKPADLPVQQPTRFELVVNLNTAQALGLTVPPSILARADEVIE